MQQEWWKRLRLALIYLSSYFEWYNQYYLDIQNVVHLEQLLKINFFFDPKLQMPLIPQHQPIQITKNLVQLLLTTCLLSVFNFEHCRCDVV